jgi:hypothetical protein
MNSSSYSHFRPEVAIETSMSATQLVRYKHGKNTFEVMTHVGATQKFRDGKLGLDNVLQADVIWTNQSKGERAKGAELKESFDTEDLMECIKTILAKGEIQLTAAERREMLEAKRKEIGISLCFTVGPLYRFQFTIFTSITLILEQKHPIRYVSCCFFFTSYML